MFFVEQNPRWHISVDSLLRKEIHSVCLGQDSRPRANANSPFGVVVLESTSRLERAEAKH